jgi:hypothetical protein
LVIMLIAYIPLNRIDDEIGICCFSANARSIKEEEQRLVLSESG